MHLVNACYYLTTSLLKTALSFDSKIHKFVLRQLNTYTFLLIRKPISKTVLINCRFPAYFVIRSNPILT